MRLKTIWTIPTMSFRERLNRTGEWAALAVARRLPTWLRYWTFIYEGGRLMAPDDVVPEVPFVDLLARSGS